MSANVVRLSHRRPGTRSTRCSAPLAARVDVFDSSGELASTRPLCDDCTRELCSIFAHRVQLVVPGASLVVRPLG